MLNKAEKVDAIMAYLKIAMPPFMPKGLLARKASAYVERRVTFYYRRK